MDKESISFDIKTGMKNIIGRDLITDDFIAIYELVKNSYDAYADHVTITFNDDEIIIMDNGKGMSERDLKEKWFAVAYSAKKDGSEDDDIKRSPHLNNLKSRRYYAGAKGIGRFSCDRIGNSLKLITTHIDSKETCKIDINWNKFEENAKQSFNSIHIPFEKSNEIPTYINQKHGTVLIITKLNSVWSENRLLELKHSLEKIINPFSNEQNGFSIEIIAPKFKDYDLNKTSFQRINGKIANSILSVLKIKTTEIEVEVNKEKIITKIADRGSLIYHIEEKNIYSDFIDNLQIGLYYLNRSAKINFGKIMDIEPVNYGNVFLFKNGFRVQPYGETRDDSWNIDQRKQQGYNRFLGTRDLFGKVDLITERFDQFKEVSSRDGGLVETNGKRILFNIFTEKALKRLERYVVGVLWGEGFARKNYFLNESLAQNLREELKDDKDKDSYEDVIKNLGSKIDFVNLIKTLSDDDDIRIICFNKKFIDFVNERLDEVQPKFISDLTKIAEKTNDLNLLDQIKLTEANFSKLVQEKEDAIERARIAEIKAIEAEKNRLKEEQLRKEAEDKRREAEFDTLKKEKERALAELAKLRAEQEVREAIEQRAKAEAGKKQAEQKLGIEKSKNRYLSATRNLTPEVEDIIHTIKISSNELESSSKSIMNIARSIPDGDKIIRELGYLEFHIERINKLSNLLTKADINSLKEHTKVDIPVYIKEYLPNYSFSIKDIQFNQNYTEPFIRKIPLLDLSVILDNLISNSKKAGATKIYVDFKKEREKLHVDFSDDGVGVDESLIKEDSLFEIGITSRRGGSGIGLSTIKETLRKELYGDIIFIGNNIHFKTGATFRLIF